MAFRIFLLISISFIGSKSLSQQWQSANTGLNGGDVRVIFEEGGLLFAGTENAGLFRSLDQGETWIQSNNGLSLPQWSQDIHHVSSLTSLKDTIFLGSYSHNIFYSLDFGDSWSLTPGQPSNTQITSLLNLDGVLFAGTVSGLYASKDAGITWEMSSNGLPDASFINSVTQVDSALIAGVYFGGAFLSIDSGKTWNRIESIPSDANVSGTFVDELDVYIIARNLYKSQRGVGDFSVASTPEHIYDLDTFANRLIVATLNGVFSSSDNGVSWEKADISSTPVSYAEAYDNFGELFVSDSEILISNASFGILSSQDGINWVLKNSGINGVNVDWVTSDDIYIYASGSTGLFRSTDGNNWEELKDEDFKFQRPITNGDSLVVVGGSLHLSTDHGDTWSNFPLTGITKSSWQPRFFGSSQFFLTAGNSLFRFDYDASQWVEIFSMETTFPINGFMKVGDTLMICNYSELHRSVDNGDNWEKIVNGLPANLYIRGISQLEKVIFLQNNNSYYRSYDIGDTWELLELNSAGNGLYASSGKYLLTKNFGYSQFSPDLGTTWITIDEQKSFKYTSDFAEKDGYIYCGTTEGVWKANPEDFEHKIYSVSPLTAAVGDEVTILGQKFSTDPGTNQVFLGEIEADVIESTTESIVFRVPDGATNGFVTINILGREVIGEESICIKPDQPIIKDSLDINGELLLVASSMINNQWYFDDAEMEGEHDYFIYPGLNGNYSVINIGDGCNSDPSDVYLVCLDIPVPTITDSVAISGDLFLKSSSVDGNQWYLDGEPVEGTDQSYKPLESGSYSLKVTDAIGCESSFSESFEYTQPLSARYLKGQPKMFPNPVSEYFTLEFGIKSFRKFRLYDISGILHTNFSGASNSFQVDVRNYPRGIYFLSIQEENSISVLKFMKE